jgi:hypothetical protein
MVPGINSLNPKDIHAERDFPPFSRNSSILLVDIIVKIILEK